MDEEDPIGEINPIRYRSYYYDDEIGLYYLRARYYDPETGRFISRDNISYFNPWHLTGLNLYAYGNNSIMCKDPSGCAWEWFETWKEKSLILNYVPILFNNLDASAGLSIGVGGSFKVFKIFNITAITRMDFIGFDTSHEESKWGQYGKSGASIGVSPFDGVSSKEAVLGVGWESNTYESFDGTKREILPDETDYSISLGFDFAIILGAHAEVSLSLKGMLSDFKNIISMW